VKVLRIGHLKKKVKKKVRKKITPEKLTMEKRDKKIINFLKDNPQSLVFILQEGEPVMNND